MSESLNGEACEKKLYILGHPVSHSKSPVMYNALYEALGLPWHYDFMDLPSDSDARDFLKARDFLSVNITTPYKPIAYEVATHKAASAQLAQGVNLLVVKDEAMIGYNVDGEGCVRFLELAGVCFKEAKVAVCGTGPTALAILHSAVQAGASEVLLLGRDKDRACRVIGRYMDTYRHLAMTAIDMPSAVEGHLGFGEAYRHAEFKYGSYATSKKAIAEADVIIDATSLGMHDGDPAPFDIGLLSSGQVVMDTVYGHGTTAIIQAAQDAGCQAFDGAGMLVSQAVLSATIVCEVQGVELELTYDEMFRLMSKAAAFNCG